MRTTRARHAIRDARFTVEDVHEDEENAKEAGRLKKALRALEDAEAHLKDYDENLDERLTNE